VHKSDDKIKNTLIRNTVTKIIEYLDSDKIIRCHRAYIINLDFVKRIEGNAQGLKLNLSNSENVIPVSRKYVDVVRENSILIGEFYHNLCRSSHIFVKYPI
jgi:DNA-binding LytR/AlgR family response regulator